MRKLFLILVIFLNACGWVSPEGKVVSVAEEKIVETDENFFVNQEYGLKIPKLENFVGEETENGVIFKRPNTAQRIYKSEKINENYTVEIGVTAEENLLGYADLGDFLNKEYAGFSFEFSGRGVYVDEYSGTDSVHNFFVIGDGGAMIYHAYLRVPSYFYDVHREGFEDFVERVEFH